MRRTTIVASVWSAFILVVLTFVGVRPVSPDTIYEGDVCFKCRRAIDDTRLAAETLDRQLPTKYRTPDTRFFVTDYVSGRLVGVDRAFFVPVLVNDRTGERDYRAYHSREAATAAAGELGVGVVSWTTVVERARARV